MTTRAATGIGTHRGAALVGARSAYRPGRSHSSVSARGDEFHSRRADRARLSRGASASAARACAAHAAGRRARHRRAAGLPFFLFSQPRPGAAAGGQSGQLSVAAADRVVLGAAARQRRRAAVASSGGRFDGLRRRGFGHYREHGGASRARSFRDRRLRRGAAVGIDLGDVFGAVAAVRVGAEQRRRTLLRRHRARRSAGSFRGRANRLATRRHPMAGLRRPGAGAGRPRLLCVGLRLQARRSARAWRRRLFCAAALDAPADRFRPRRRQPHALARRRGNHGRRAAGLEGFAAFSREGGRNRTPRRPSDATRASAGDPFSRASRCRLNRASGSCSEDRRFAAAPAARRPAHVRRNRNRWAAERPHAVRGDGSPRSGWP